MRFTFPTLLLVCASWILAGCSDTFVDPFDNEARYFTIYGHIDQLETNHSVRVIPVTRLPSVITDPGDANATLDAVVTSTNLRTGETTRWTHSLERLEDDTYAHIFRASFRVTAGTTYRLQVQRSDGITAFAETTVPRIAESFIYEIDSLQVTPITPDSSLITQHITIPNVPSLWDIEAIYFISGGLVNHRIFTPYGRSGARTPDGGWEVTINLSQDKAYVIEDMHRSATLGLLDDTDPPVTLTAMGLRIRMLDANWDPPEGIFDPELLAQPGSLSNVVNGYGFWGSVGLFTEEWNVSASVAQQAEMFQLRLGF